MSTDSELQAKHNAAVECFKDAEWAEETALKKRNEKQALAQETQKGTKEYYFAWAEVWNAEVVLLEKIEQRCGAAFTRNSCYADCMKYRRGSDSKEAQIAQHRAELARTMEFIDTHYPLYWIKWDKLDNIALFVYYHLKAEGYVKIADDLERAQDMFCKLIYRESNGKTLSRAWHAAVEALDEWEQNDNRAAWDKAKQVYDSALAKWNHFKPKGEQYAEELQVKICQYVNLSSPVYAIVSQWESSALNDALDQKSQMIADLNDQLDEKDQQIAALKNELHQKSQENKEKDRENRYLRGRISELERKVKEFNVLERDILGEE
ncbi:uncharacterized protein TM35_000641240 [Trypanosoma theileri]|uniref:Uncharacterized protein n=1 Tax=Trypanosoma theileri TaxID=67003 RepID=A0A1X0NFU0_9TRYP|nr:uncharacterized protein TM35_000641240 [Trypanosoma theileri]ORC83592.1 hypothetical protein TM35_000641240 [Trypanosoma theileri]